jgi:hypothetical protein
MIQNNKRGGGRGTTKRSARRRNAGPKNSSMNSVPRDVTRFVAGGSGSVFGFPNKVLTRLRYTDTIAMVGTSGAIAKQLFRLNSTFDPDYTGTGHQPLYRDTYASLYDHYAVVETRVHVKLVNNGDIPVNCGILVDDDATSSTTTTVLMEQNNGQSRVVPAKTGALSTVDFRYNWSCQKILGIDPFASETYKTAVGSNPTEESYLVIWNQAADVTTTSGVYAYVELEMLVLWTELTTPTSS